MSTEATPTEDIGKALGTDYLLIRPDLTEAERDYLDRTRRFVEEEVLPVINGYWERAELPLGLLHRLGELGLVGDGIEGYGCPDMSPIAAGLVHMELNRGDGSLGTALGVQAGLAMRSIAMLGSEEQKQRWLPAMARTDKLGAFALTEPEHGSDSVSLETSARRDGETYVLNGAKRWIGLATVADVVVVWARDTEDGKVKGFLVDPSDARLPGQRDRGQGGVAGGVAGRHHPVRRARPGRGPAAGGQRLRGHRQGAALDPQTCAWAALGHAVAAYDAALTYTRRRKQFGSELVRFQLVQERLVHMLADVTAMQLYCLRLGRLMEAGGLSDAIAALAKLNNTVKARQVTAEARNLLGGNGLLLEYHVIRHMSDIEAIYTYEGTEAIQTLLVGRDITGVGAFV